MPLQEFFLRESFLQMVSAPGERYQLTPVNHYTTGGKLWEMDFGLILGHIWTTQIHNSMIHESLD